jgi:hypothetical protein
MRYFACCWYVFAATWNHFWYINFSFGHLSSGRSIFTWAGIWGSLIIFQSQKGSTSLWFWETPAHTVSFLVVFVSLKRLLTSLESCVTNVWAVSVSPVSRDFIDLIFWTYFLISCKFASGFCFLRPVPNITMTLHSYWPLIPVGGSSIRERYWVLVNYLQRVPGTRVTKCCITMSPSTGVVLNSHVGTGRCICRACSSSVCWMVLGWQAFKM